MYDSTADNQLRREGLKIVLADIDTQKLNEAAKALIAEYGEGNILAVPTDVSKLDQVQALADRTLETFGEVNTQRAFGSPARYVPSLP